MVMLFGQNKFVKNQKTNDGALSGVFISTFVLNVSH